MVTLKILEIPIKGMDCVECTLHVRKAIEQLPGVASVQVMLSSEKAVLRIDPARVDISSIRKAVEHAGYSVGETEPPSAFNRPLNMVNQRAGVLFGLVFGIVIALTVGGELFGLFNFLNQLVPLPVGILIVLLGGLPVFRPVIQAAFHRRITSHSLMTMGTIAALAVGEWVTAAIVVLFMHVGRRVEGFTTEKARHAVKELASLAPQTARVERPGGEQEVPISAVRVGEVVVVRPGEMIPVDGEVISGHATVNQATITGEPMPIEVAPGSTVYAATFATLGSLRVKTVRVGQDTTIGRVIKLVEDAETHRAEVQRFADAFSAYYLPVVLGIASLSFLITRNPLAAASVLVVACSCSIALATPIAMLASLGASAKRGILIKGGKYLEALAQADIVLVDKTGTLTLGKPHITRIINLSSFPDSEILSLAASAERYSEHPLAEAIRATARERNLPLVDLEDFEALPGRGVRATVQGYRVEVGNHTLLSPTVHLPPPNEIPPKDIRSQAAHLPPGVHVSDPSNLSANVPGETDIPLDFPEKELQGKGSTLLFVRVDGKLAGALEASDTLRPEVPEAIQHLRALGLSHIELLTGDNEGSAASLSRQIGIPYRAQLLPEDKIRIIREYQAQGHVVVMVGDGVNDAPALAQADVGIAMGVGGTDIALEAAPMALIKEDWTQVPDLFRIARRTMRVVKTNLIFTALYNLIGLALAAFGLLPPVLAAAAQSLPDVGILLNSARLLRPPD